MKAKYVAIDIGASSGRLIMSEITEDGCFKLEEIHRFKNFFRKVGKYDCWDVANITQEILSGLQKVKQKGVENCYLGIDTWGVDYCLIDHAGKLVGQPICYRDRRTASCVSEFAKKISLNTLYEKTGIQIQPFNTIFQLFVEEQSKLAQAKSLMLIPDYLGYYFTGKSAFEKTNASTTQLLNATTKKIDNTILSQLNLEETLFPKLTEPGTILGELDRLKFADYDLPQATFITVASHDTASAIAGTPGEGDDWAYISSGTWSLMGVESEQAIATPATFAANFTNEWGVQGTVRFLKNIMGMWLIQEVAHMQSYKYSYAELAKLASREKAFEYLVDVNDARFLNPVNMISAIQEYCQETDQPVPQTAGELSRCIYDSLAICYAIELAELERMTGHQIKQLHIVGGGSHNALLNQLTANTCGIPVLAGPSEATAIGNILVQMVATEGFGTLVEGRQAIKRSFPIKTYLPAKDAKAGILKYKQLTNTTA